MGQQRRFESPAVDVRFAPESDRLLRRREVTRRAIRDQNASQQTFILDRR
jgi:hypothetical protein